MSGTSTLAHGAITNGRRANAMGLYDEVVCHYPLPDGYDASGIVFQTKHLGCGMARWTITQDGNLLDPEGRWTSNYTAELTMIYSNSLAAGKGYVCTVDDAPCTLWRYTLYFNAGQVVAARGGAQPMGSGTQIPRARFLSEVWGRNTQSEGNDDA